MIETLTALKDAFDDPDIDLTTVCNVLADSIAEALPAFLGLTVMVHMGDTPLGQRTSPPATASRSAPRYN